MAEGDVILEVKDVWQNLGGNQILEGVNFQVTDRVRPGVVTGQVVGLLGPSGVGKTRLLRIVAGLDAPDKGSVAGVKGKTLEAGSVGVVFQSYPLLKHRTVLDNLRVAAAANGLSADAAKKRSLELLARFGLAERVGFYPGQLSGGQKQRVAIAQQLICNKSLLLMDEPFSGLDPAALDEVIELLLEVAHMDELNTLVVVTHDIRSAMIVSDHLLMLGRDFGANKKPTCGARIKHDYDLVERGLAWQPDIQQKPVFTELEKELKARFRDL
jgi:polar amino acid transport system ATP-binding protein/sulfate transport system ATP-binding protein